MLNLKNHICMWSGVWMFHSLFVFKFCESESFTGWCYLWSDFRLQPLCVCVNIVIVCWLKAVTCTSRGERHRGGRADWKVQINPRYPFILGLKMWTSYMNLVNLCPWMSVWRQTAGVRSLRVEGSFVFDLFHKDSSAPWTVHDLLGFFAWLIKVLLNM